MKTGQAYRDSLRARSIRVYLKGELLDSRTLIDHPFIRGHVNAAAMTYELAEDPRYEDLMTAVSHLTGKRINRFTHIHQSREDLVKKVKMLRMISLNTGTCYQRCVGLDAVNAIYSVTYEMDQALGTDYHQRLRKYLEYWQEEDLMVAGAMTDPKGDRSLRPSQQADPDLFVHVVKKDGKGIYLRGAKMHMTGMVNSHEMLIMPTAGYGEADKDYAVCCALPVDAPGVLHIFGRQTNDGRKLEGEIDQGNARFGVVGGECLTVLEDVFVPWERVFLCGEYQYTGMLVERFACSIACSAEGRPTASGSYYVDPLLANVGKHNVTKLIYDIDRLAQDIGGGLLATMPSEADLRSPEVGKYVEKFYQGVQGVDTTDRLRVARLLEVMTGGVALVESMHGAGSPQAQKVMYAKLSNLENKKKAALAIAGVDPEKYGGA